MGMIIPWRFVRQGLVPTAGEFEGVAHAILDIADREKVFKAAAILGSVARGDHHPRSDLDLILVAHDRTYARAQDLERRFGRLAADRGIPFDCHLLSASDARLGRHMYGPSYMGTFPTGPTPYSIGRPLAECFRVPETSVQAEMLKKLEHKLHSTRTRAGIFYARYHPDPDALESWLLSNWSRVVRPLRVHITLARRLLWWRHGVLHDDGKAEVITRFLAEQTFAPLHEDYQALLHFDYRYDELFARAVNGRERRASYLRKVGDLLDDNFRVSLNILANAVDLTRQSSFQVEHAA